MKNEENNQPAQNLPPRSTRFNFSKNRLTAPAPKENTQREHVHTPEPVLPSQPHLGGRKNYHTDKTGPLIFNVSTLLRDFEGARRDHDFEQETLNMALEEGEKPAEATNVSGHIRLTNVRGGVLARGSGEADVILECVRCLNDFEYHVEYEIEEMFRPLIDIATGYPVKTETLDEETDLKLDSNHLLNLGEAIRQQILVSVPINPICGDDCPGLVDELNRVNEAESELEAEEPVEEEPEPEVVDKRWAALSKLLQNSSEKEK